ncbi:Deoxynucleotidyltransferase terminal interacting [Fasciolopsis buskii]|uniref:Deoxynucleotidyltransferase terminal interacting n=1 Tax=Fasciolopsis buskii TaxID=27845 RepID=A0A8E0VF96_9TREM|nr:Deoxynucleotidyltransferase terminal interacting [Fasciolopsis buski]
MFWFPLPDILSVSIHKLPNGYHNTRIPPCLSFFRWKPPITLSDCSSEYLSHCPVDYSLLQNPFSKKPENIGPEEETKLWQGLGIVRPIHDPTTSNTDVENPFYTTSVPGLHSKREVTRMRKAERNSKLSGWYDLPKPNLTDEDREDLDVIRMRRALSTETHVRRSDTKAKYYQRGVVVDDPGSFYDRLPKKLRGKTIVDELLANAELMRLQRKRYSKIERENAEKRSAMRRQKQQQLKRIKDRSGRKQRTVVVPI